MTMNELSFGKVYGHSPFLSLLLNIVVYLENSSIIAAIKQIKSIYERSKLSTVAAVMAEIKGTYPLCTSTKSRL